MNLDDYWLIVAKPEPEHSSDLYVLKCSTEIALGKVAVLSGTTISRRWANSLPAGVYQIWCNPTIGTISHPVHTIKQLMDFQHLPLGVDTNLGSGPSPIGTPIADDFSSIAKALQNINPKA